MNDNPKSKADSDIVNLVAALALVCFGFGVAAGLAIDNGRVLENVLSGDIKCAKSGKGYYCE